MCVAAGRTDPRREREHGVESMRGYVQLKVHLMWSWSWHWNIRVIREYRRIHRFIWSSVGGRVLITVQWLSEPMGLIL